MGKIWVYKYEISDTNSGETTFYDEQICTSKKDAEFLLTMYYSQNATFLEITDGFFSGCRAWHSTKDGRHIEYGVYSIEK